MRSLTNKNIKYNIVVGVEEGGVEEVWNRKDGWINKELFDRMASGLSREDQEDVRRFIEDWSGSK